MIRPNFDIVQKSLLAGAAALLVLGIGAPNLSLLDSDQQIATSLIPGSTPEVCIGFDPLDQQWGAERGMCPENYAAYGIDDPGGKERPGAKLDAQLVCCPLPANDILTDEHVMAEDSCPDGYVATGSTGFGCGLDCTKKLRCTRINSSRYQLGQMQASRYWGNGHAGWKRAERVEWEDIPAGMRFSIGRLSSDKWGVDGCVGYPWGSLLTQKKEKYCSGMYFRQLQFAGAAGDPEKGTAVRMYPECAEVIDYDKPGHARCAEG